MSRDSTVSKACSQGASGAGAGTLASTAGAVSGLGGADSSPAGTAAESEPTASDVFAAASFRASIFFASSALRSLSSLACISAANFSASALSFSLAAPSFSSACPGAAAVPGAGPTFWLVLRPSSFLADFVVSSPLRHAAAWRATSRAASPLERAWASGKGSSVSWAPAFKRLMFWATKASGLARNRANISCSAVRFSVRSRAAICRAVSPFWTMVLRRFTGVLPIGWGSAAGAVCAASAFAPVASAVAAGTTGGIFSGTSTTAGVAATTDPASVLIFS